MVRFRFFMTTAIILVAIVRGGPNGQLAPGANCLAEELDASSSLTAAEALRWGEETLATIRDDFLLEESGFYTEHRLRRRRKPRPAFMWSAGVQLTALTAATRLEPEKYQADLAKYIEVLKTYWNNNQGVGGYDVQPHSTNPDRYYDDNAWIVLALLEAHQVTGNSKHLEQAERTFEFVLSGEDDTLGGGIYWREREKNSKNTCSNAPATVAALRLFQATQDPKYLDIGERLYDWTCAHLQDKSDGLFWDNIARDGRIDRRKYSYNSALMIRANCLLFEQSKEIKYLAEAQRIARAAEFRWIDSKSGAIDDAGKFAHMLLESLLAVRRHDGDSHWLQTCERCVTFVHEELQDRRGHYPSRWEERPSRPARSIELIDQASAARAFLVVAHALREADAATATSSENAIKSSKPDRRR